MTAPLSNMSATITHEASMSRGAQYKCKRCKGSLVGGSANDCRRSPSGGYEHRDPPGCKHFNDLAKAKRAKPPQQSSGSLRDDGHVARARSSPRKKPSSRKPALPQRICKLPGCGREFQPTKSNHVYCSPACGIRGAHGHTERRSEYKAKEKLRATEKREREKTLERRAFDLAAARGEHAHIGGQGTPGGTVCANGTEACKYWVRQNPRPCQNPECSNVLNERQDKFCSHRCSGTISGALNDATNRARRGKHVKVHLGWPMNDGSGRCH